ncbi:MAG: class I SAM-dependent methyltransferase [Deltaproteobacteria bacterium]|jgi:cephalosporin hydroxylase|nr:class I SAM-dependent methyltransferase [Deltaproteobacteria bacterium]
MAHEGVYKEYYESYQGKKQGMAKPAHYLQLYGNFLEDLADLDLVLLELGVGDGQSLEFFSKLLPKARIFGVDIKKRERAFADGRVKIYQGAQDDPALFQKIMEENGLAGFDVVVDDCSHIGGLTLDSFNILFPRLSSGGFYIIEDWGTGYWPDYPGGMKFQAQNHLKRKVMTAGSTVREYFLSHQYGIPGMIKQLVDEVGMGDISRGLQEMMPSKISELHVYPGIIFLRKV